MCVCVCVCVYGTVISKTVLKSVHVISTNFTSTFTVCITGNAVVPVKPCEHAQVGPNWDYDILLCHEGGSKDFATKHWLPDIFVLFWTKHAFWEARLFLQRWPKLSTCPVL